MKKLLPILFVFGLIVPQVTFASWWNPFTWSKSDASVETRIKELEEKVASTTQKNIEPQIITKTVTLDSSDLQLKINALMKENIQLKAQIQSLTSQLSLLQKNPANTQVVQTKTVNVVTENKPLVISVDKKYSSTDSSGYGSYSARVWVTAGDHDIYIPKSTSDSSGGIAGIAYSVQGDSFSGYQSSLVDCTTLKAVNGVVYCLVLAGQKLDLKVSITLRADKASNYGIKIEKINFWNAEKDDWDSSTLGDTAILDSVYIK